jgi:hypothetical protein
MLKEPGPGEGVAAARGPALLDLCLRHPRQPGQDRGLFRFLFRGPPSGFGFPADGDRAGDEAGFADGVGADGPGARLAACGAAVVAAHLRGAGGDLPGFFRRGPPCAGAHRAASVTSS